jgi:undecaprenyl diphosphate synthase
LSLCFTKLHITRLNPRDGCFAEGVELSLSEVFTKLQLPAKPDLLIRTSGINQTFNFLVLQMAETPIAVVDEQWPELSLRELARMLITHPLRRSLGQHLKRPSVAFSLPFGKMRKLPNLAGK